MNYLTTEIKEICKRFFPSFDITMVDLVTAGNINNTYKITVNDGKNTNYILQRINKYVFKEPKMVMQNIKKVSEHLQNRTREQLFNGKNKHSLIKFINADNNNIFYIDKKGEYWRCYNYFDNSITYNTTNNLCVIEEVGFAFGEFQNLLSDFDASLLFEIIPNFHNTTMRLKALEDAFYRDKFNRAKYVNNEYLFLQLNKHYAEELRNKAKNLPIRVTHNDTKCNNVLIDVQTEKAITVIDLDTVMAGIVAYDFGDGVRSIVSICDEDETDINKIKIDLNKFKAFSKGFISGLNSNLTNEEFDSLALGILVMTLELATRFLTDYLCGDKYFKIKTPKHNLERAKCQIQLFKEFEQNIDKINDYIFELKHKI